MKVAIPNSEVHARLSGWKDVLKTHGRVVLALALRDIKTRAGASYLGFLFSLILPVGHIGVIVLAYVAFGRRPAIGTDILLFLSSAVVPFVIWSYTHQKMTIAFMQNIPLTSFPVVKLMDIAVARAGVEFISSTLVSCVMIVTIIFFGSDVFVNDMPMLVYAGFLAYLFGISTGLTFGILSIVNNVFAMAGFLLIPMFWLSSGVLFIPDALPEILRYYVSIFALAHIVDLARIAIFPGYISSFPSLIFVLSAITANIMFFLFMTVTFRAKLLSP